MAAADLDHSDPIFPVVIAIRAVKPAVVAQGAVHASRPDVAPRGDPRLPSHRLASALIPTALCTPPDAFREHMDYISRECQPIGLDDLLQAAASGHIPERAVAVTLDDGYLDALTTASPILEDAGVPATFFVNTDRLMRSTSAGGTSSSACFSVSETLPAESWTSLLVRSDLRLPTTNRAKRAEALDRLNQAAWPLDARERGGGCCRMSSRGVAGRVAPRASHRVLTDDEVRRLAGRPGHTIGSHTVHHLALTTQPSGYEAPGNRRRQGDARAPSAARRVHLFSYPYGDFDAEVVEAVSDAGFRGGRHRGDRHGHGRDKSSAVAAM